MQAADSPAPATPDAAPDVQQVAANAARFATAALALYRAEIALARRSLQALAAGAMVAPVLLVGLWFSVLALVLLALQAAGLSWLAAAALDCLAQALLLWALLRRVRRWSRDLSLPHSRALLNRLLEPHT